MSDEDALARRQRDRRAAGRDVRARDDDRRPRVRVVRRGTARSARTGCTAAPGSSCAARRAATSRCGSPCSPDRRVLTLRGSWTVGCRADARARRRRARRRVTPPRGGTGRRGRGPARRTRRLEDLEVDADLGDVDGEPAEPVRAGEQQARVLVDRLERPDRGRHARRDLGERRVQDDPRLPAVARLRDAARDVRGDVLGRRLARDEARGRPTARASIRSTRKVRQSLAAGVPRDEVPAPAGVDEAVRLDEAARAACRRGRGRRTAAARGRGTRRRSPRACPGRRSGPVNAIGHGAERTALTRRRSRAGRTCSSLASARTEVSSMPADPRARGGAQADRDGHRLLVVEQQRRQRRAGARR